MPHLISNLYEKNYTPFTAKLAPRDLCNRPALGTFTFALCVTYQVIMMHLVLIIDCLLYRKKTTESYKTRC